MAKKNTKEKLIEIAAGVLSMKPETLALAIDNALDVSILKRDNQLLAEMLIRERNQHENEIKELKKGR